MKKRSLELWGISFLLLPVSIMLLAGVLAIMKLVVGAVIVIYNWQLAKYIPFVIAGIVLIAAAAVIRFSGIPDSILKYSSEKKKGGKN